MTEYKPVPTFATEEREPEPDHESESEPHHDSEPDRKSAPDHESESKLPQAGPQRDNAHQLDQSGPLPLAQPNTLDRTAVDILLLAATDVLMVAAWTGMFIYTVLVWYARDKFVDEISFSAAELIGAATT